MTNSCANCSKVLPTGRDADLWTPWEIGSLLVATVMITVANLFLLYLFVRYIKDKSFSNMLFLSLIISDLIVGVLALPLDIVDMIQHSVYVNSVFLSLFGYIVVNAQSSVSIYILLVLTAHRLNLIKRPLKANEKLTKTKKAILIGIWAMIYFAWTCNIMLSYAAGYYEASSATFVAEAPWVSLFMVILSYLMPAFLMVPLTALVIISLQAKIKRTNLATMSSSSITDRSTTNIKFITNMDDATSVQVSNRTSDRSASSYSKSHNHIRVNPHARQIREVRAIICLLAIGASVFFSQIFYIIMTTLDDYGLVSNPIWLRLATWLSYLNSIFNPMILVIFHDSFRKQSKKFFDRLQAQC